MCGIAGVIKQGSKENLQAILTRMLEATKHRGPNHTGTFISDGIAIGMNRLSIIDLSDSANQPLHSEDDRYSIVYNGEVYNFHEIKKNLVSKGVRFSTQSDTEVVLAAYIHYGKEMVDILRGMFAFVIWDKKERLLFGARDHLGIKPLLYSLQNNEFVFCSELKGFLASGLYNENKLDIHSINSYLAIGNTIPPYSMVEGINALKSGHYFTFKNGQFNEMPYWFPESIEPISSKDISYDECVQKVRELVLASVKEELMSDVPLGVFQSGGLDSAIVTAAMRICGVSDIKTYTIGFEESPSGIDESNDAVEIAKFYNTKHSAVKISNNFIEENFIDYVKALDQPSADGLNTYLVSKYTANGVTVALSGLGADELFIGYYGYLQYLNRKPRRPFNYLRNLIKNPYISETLTEKTYHVLYEEFSKSDDILTYIFILQRNHERFNTKLLKNFDVKNSHSMTRDIIKDNYSFSKHDIVKIKQLYINQFMSNMLLRDSDAVAMKSSLEVRFPLIDRRIVEFSLQIPFEYQIQDSASLGGRNYAKNGLKRILRDAFVNELPPNLLNRNKRGFQLPTNIWLKKPLAGLLENTFNQPSEIFKPKEIIKHYHQWQKDNSHWKKVWSIFILDQWYKNVFKLNSNCK